MAEIPDKNTQKRPKNKNLKKAERQLHLTHLGGPPYQFLAQMGHLVAQKIEWRGKSESRF